MYILYFVKKEYCSYDLNGLNNIYNIFYTKQQLKKEVFVLCGKKVISKIRGIVGKVR